jgi:hypothetical protein
MQNTAIPKSAGLPGLLIMTPPQRTIIRFDRGKFAVRDQVMGLQRECGGRGTHPDEILGSQVASDEGTILETPCLGKVAAASLGDVSINLPAGSPFHHS